MVCQVDKFFETTNPRVGQSTSVILNLTVLETSSDELRVGGQYAIVNKLDKEVAFAAVKAALCALGVDPADLEGKEGEARMEQLVPQAPQEIAEEFEGAILRVWTSPAVSKNGRDYTRISYAALADDEIDKYMEIAESLGN